MLLAADAQRVQAFQIQFLGIARVGLENDLELSMHLHTVGVIPVPPIVGPVGGLDVGHVPGFRPQDAQNGGGVHRPRADFFAVGLPDEAAVVGPELLQAEDDLLEG